MCERHLILDRVDGDVVPGFHFGLWFDFGDFFSGSEARRLAGFVVASAGVLVLVIFGADDVRASQEFSGSGRLSGGVEDDRVGQNAALRLVQGDER